MIRVLIADHDHALSVSIARVLSSEQGVAVLPNAGNVNQMVSSIVKHKPDIVFAAIEILESGVHVLSGIPAETMPVIVAVLPEHHPAMQSLKSNRIEFLKTSFNGEDLRRAFQHVRTRLREGHAQDEAERLLQSLEQSQSWAQKDNRLFLKSGGKVVFVNADEIEWVEAAANYVHVHTGSEIHSIRATITAFEAHLDAAQFIRIHRSAIVNVEKIKELQPCKNGELLLILRSGKQLSVSRNFRGRMQDFIKGLGRKPLD